MEFDLSWILLGLPLAFVLGWLASRFDLRQLRAENRRAPKAYFKGLNFLLNEQQDQAIDAFIEAVQNDPDTSELHFALGNLYARQNRWPEAQQVYFNAVAAEGDNPDYLFNLAVSLDHLRQPRLAGQHYRLALEAAGRRPAAFDRAGVEKRLAELEPPR